MGSDTTEPTHPLRLTGGLAADCLAAVLLPMSCLLGAFLPAVGVFGAYTLAGAEPSSSVLAVSALLGLGCTFVAASSLFSPRIPMRRRIVAVVTGLATFGVVGRLIPFTTLDEKPFPFQTIDVVEEVVLLGGSYGSMFMAALAVLRWGSARAGEQRGAPDKVRR